MLVSSRPACRPDQGRREGRSLAALIALVGLVLSGLTLLGTPVASAAHAKQTSGKVKLRASFSHKSYTVGQRPVLKVTAKVKKRRGHPQAARGKVVVAVLGHKSRAKVRRGKATVKLPKLAKPGKFTTRITFRGKGLPKRTVKRKLVVKAASSTARWHVPDPEMRAQIRAALKLPDNHALTLADAARLNNANGASLYFGDVGTAAGLDLATNLTQLTDFTAGEARDSRGLENIVRVNGEFWISNGIQHASYPSVTHIAGELEVFNLEPEHLTSIALPALIDVKRIMITQRPQLTSVSLPRLATVRGNVEITDDAALTTVDLPSLATVAGSIRIEDLDSATAIRLPELRDAAGLTVSDAARVVALELSRLTQVNGTLFISDLPLLQELTAARLQHVAGDLRIYFLGSIGALRMPALQWSHGRVSFGIGEDFPALPRDGSAVSFGAFDVSQAQDFDFSVKDGTSDGDTPAERWQQFLAHYGLL